MSGHESTSELWADRSVRCVIVPNGTHVDVELRNADGAAFLRKSVPNRQAARNEAEYLRLLLSAETRPTPERALMPFALVIEDDRDNRDAIVAALKLCGIRVLACGTAAAAIEHARALSPDLIVVDYRLPDMTGSALCAALRGDPATAFAPIIAVTASPEAVRREGCPADALLSKPCDPETLIAAARLFLRRALAADAAG
jgi:CheY-like chemotaxis protein